MATEVTSVGSHTDLWRPNEGRLSSMVDKLGWRRLFPPLRKAWDTLGTLRPEVAAATGLAPNVRVVCGAHDFERVPRAPSRYEARSVHRDLDRNLGHHHGRRGKEPARPEGRHAGQRRRAWAPRADRALHGRPRIRGLAGDKPAEAGEADVAAVVASGALALPAFCDQGGPFAGRKGRIEGERPRRLRRARRSRPSMRA